MVALDKSLASNLRLLGGIWILQTFPAIVVGRYIRWLHRWALLAGWAAGMVYAGTLLLRASRASAGRDRTQPADYRVDADDPQIPVA